MNVFVFCVIYGWLVFVQRAARFLVDEVDRWEEDHNSIVQIAKKMAQQMMEMAQFARRRGKLQVFLVIIVSGL